MKKLSTILLLLSVNTYALEHEEIVKQIKAPIKKNEVMTISPHAKKQENYKKLFGPALLKQIEEEKKPKESHKPQSFFNNILNAYIKKAYAFAPAPKPSPTPDLGIDLRHKDTPVKNQIGPRCTAYGLIAAIENLHGQKIDLSEAELWFRYQQYSIYPAMQKAKENKITKEAFWPENKDTPNLGHENNRVVKLAKETHLGTNFDLIKSKLKEGKPIYFAFRVPKDLNTCSAVVREDSQMTDGGHAVMISGYKIAPEIKDGFYLIIKNSWGTNCHDKGYVYLTPSFCKRTDGYCTFYSIDEVI